MKVKLATFALFAVSSAGTPALADTISGTLFNNIQYDQNSDSAPAAPSGYFLALVRM